MIIYENSTSYGRYSNKHTLFRRKKIKNGNALKWGRKIYFKNKLDYNNEKKKKKTARMLKFCNSSMHVSFDIFFEKWVLFNLIFFSYFLWIKFIESSKVLPKASNFAENIISKTTTFPMFDSYQLKKKSQ